MGQHLRLDRLDDESMCHWITQARKLRGKDPVDAFVASWTAFHCYYSAFADEYKTDYIVWANDLPGNKGIKHRWQFLVSHTSFQEFFETFRKQNPSVVEKLFPGPDAQGEEAGPDAAKVFSLVYQHWLRVFHMGKGHFTDKNEAELAGTFLVSLLDELLCDTEGSTKSLQQSCS